MNESFGILIVLWISACSLYFVYVMCDHTQTALDHTQKVPGVRFWLWVVVFCPHVALKRRETKQIRNLTSDTLVLGARLCVYVYTVWYVSFSDVRQDMDETPLESVRPGFRDRRNEHKIEHKIPAIFGEACEFSKSPQILGRNVTS